MLGGKPPGGATRGRWPRRRRARSWAAWRSSAPSATRAGGSTASSAAAPAARATRASRASTSRSRTSCGACSATRAKPLPGRLAGGSAAGGEAADHGHRARAEEGRGAQLRHPQAHPGIRRRDERPARRRSTTSGGEVLEGADLRETDPRPHAGDGRRGGGHATAAARSRTTSGTRGRSSTTLDQLFDLSLVRQAGRIWRARAATSWWTAHRARRAALRGEGAGARRRRRDIRARWSASDHAADRSTRSGWST